MSGSLGDSLRFWARWQPHVVAAQHGRESRTWLELDRATDRLAAGLATFGVGPDAAVAILMTNRIAYLEVAMAALKLGASVVPLSPRLVAAELEHPVRDSGAALLVTERSALDRTAHLDAALPVVLCDGDDTGLDLELLRRRGEGPPSPRVDPGSPAMICYTSGTTGVPKGVVLSHANIRAAAVQRMPVERLGVGSRVLLPTPLAYGGGLLVSFLELTLIPGGTLILQGDFDAEACLRAIEGERIEYLNVASPILDRLVEDAAFGSSDLRSLRSVCIGGAPVAPTTLEACNRRGVPLSQSYGMTETAGGATFLPPDEAERKFGSSGLPHMFTELRILNDTGAPVGAGEVGEITLQGPSIMTAYRNLPEATAETIADGWLRTGDLGSCDEEGFLTVVGRRAELIISGGLNVYPAEIERVVGDLPGIAEAVVLGVADPRWGEVPMLLIVEGSGEPVSMDRLRERLESQLAGYKQPKYLMRLDQPLPRSTSGKVKRSELRDRYPGPPADAVLLKAPATAG